MTVQVRQFNSAALTKGPGHVSGVQVHCISVRAEKLTNMKSRGHFCLGSE